MLALPACAVLGQQGDVAALPAALTPDSLWLCRAEVHPLGLGACPLRALFGAPRLC